MLRLIALAALFIAQPLNHQESAAWELHEEYHGDDLIIDHGLTASDCWAALPKNDVAHGLYFSCERPR